MVRAYGGPMDRIPCPIGQAESPAHPASALAAGRRRPRHRAEGAQPRLWDLIGVMGEIAVSTNDARQYRSPQQPLHHLELDVGRFDHAGDRHRFVGGVTLNA